MGDRVGGLLGLLSRIPAVIANLGHGEAISSEEAARGETATLGTAHLGAEGTVFVVIVEMCHGVEVSPPLPVANPLGRARTGEGPPCNLVAAALGASALGALAEGFGLLSLTCHCVASWWSVVVLAEDALALEDGVADPAEVTGAGCTVAVGGEGGSLESRGAGEPGCS